MPRESLEGDGAEARSFERIGWRLEPKRLFYLLGPFSSLSWSLAYRSSFGKVGLLGENPERLIGGLQLL